MNPDNELKLAVAIEALTKSIADWRRELRRLQRRQRELDQEEFDE